MTRTILGLCGQAQSGKSTIAGVLVANGWTRTRFADRLKAMLKTLGLTDAEIDGELKEQMCDLLGGKTPRWAMQSLGTEWGRELIHRDLWVRAWERTIERTPKSYPIVVDDVRFPNEVAAVKAFGGMVIHVERPGLPPPMDHASEWLQLPGADAIFLNNGTLDDLSFHAKALGKNMLTT